MHVPTYYYYGIIIINSTSWALERIRIIYSYTRIKYIRSYIHVYDGLKISLFSI